MKCSSHPRQQNSNLRIGSIHTPAWNQEWVSTVRRSSDVLMQTGNDIFNAFQRGERKKTALWQRYYNAVYHSGVEMSDEGISSRSMRPELRWHRVWTTRRASSLRLSLMHQTEKQSLMYRGTPLLSLWRNICAETAGVSMLMTCIYLWNKEHKLSAENSPSGVKSDRTLMFLTHGRIVRYVTQRKETRDWLFKDVTLQQGAWENKTRITAEQNLSGCDNYRCHLKNRPCTFKDIRKRHAGLFHEKTSPFLFLHAGFWRFGSKKCLKRICKWILIDWHSTDE